MSDDDDDSDTPYRTLLANLCALGTSSSRMSANPASVKPAHEPAAARPLPKQPDMQSSADIHDWPAAPKTADTSAGPVKAPAANHFPFTSAAARGSTTYAETKQPNATCTDPDTLYSSLTAKSMPAAEVHSTGISQGQSDADSIHPDHSKSPADQHHMQVSASNTPTQQADSTKSCSEHNDEDKALTADSIDSEGGFSIRKLVLATVGALGLAGASILIATVVIVARRKRGMNV